MARLRAQFWRRCPGTLLHMVCGESGHRVFGLAVEETSRELKPLVEEAERDSKPFVIEVETGVSIGGCIGCGRRDAAG